MIAKFEKRDFGNDSGIWVARYKNLYNIAHWQNEYELIHIKSGEAQVGVNSQVFAAKEGDIYLFNCGDVHYTHSLKENTIINIILFSESISKSITSHHTLDSNKLTGRYDVDKLCEDLHREIKCKDEYYKIKARSYLTEFLCDVYRNESKHEKNHSPHINYYNLYRKLTDYIDVNFSSVTFEEACSIMGFAPSYFSKIFSKISGMTFSEYLNTIKTEKAIEMLTDEYLTITEVATKCGFNSLRHFDRVFKSICGFPPSALKENANFTTPFAIKNPVLFNPTQMGEDLFEQ